MKLLLLCGSGAVGKMTVGQELCKITDFKLFHNHMSIEPVIEIFGYREEAVVQDFRNSVFTNFAKSKNYGLIFTFIWAFDLKEEWENVERICNIFEKEGADIYCVELVADEKVRFQRNETENRRNNKASKKDINFSRKLMEYENTFRLESHENEIPFKNYIKIDNTNLPAEKVAQIIKEKFNFS
ncbi:MAG: shikimate kinase [Clostridiales bacterium]|nr:shikimate kinase [Clostridiales bacterium]